LKDQLFDNPFKVNRETEKLLYNYENLKRAKDETYVSPVHLSLAAKSFKPREGKVREVKDIEALAKPSRLTQKKRIIKS
jgi:hypothetical protein